MFLALVTCMLGRAQAAPNSVALERVVAEAEALARAPAGPPLDQFLLKALLAPDIGVLPEKCAAALREGWAATDMNYRAMAFANALFELCPPTCAGDVLEDAVRAPDSDRLALLLTACDARGPDPVFTTPALRALRPQMDGMAFLMTRMTLDPVFAVTDGTALGARYAALRPALGAAMTPSRSKVEFDVPVVGGGLLVEDAQRQLANSLPAMGACYTEALRADPTLSGQIRVSAQVAAVGPPQSHVDGPVPPDLLDCVERVVREEWTLRPPQGSGTGEVSATLTLRR